MCSTPARHPREWPVFGARQIIPPTGKHMHKLEEVIL